jgi:DNA (cytosine-5)-methyltransferase 1
LKFIDWFAGIGGFRRGMELAGHECVGFCEFDKYAVMSYTAMHLCTQEQLDYLATLPMRERQEEILKEEYRNGEWYANDVRRVYAGDVPEADCWCFGFPCQDISNANKLQLGFRGSRSSLFFRIMYILGQTAEEKRPTYLFIENVKNLLSVNGGWDFARLLIELDEGGYDAEWQILNSKNFGVPHNRERCFIVASFRGSNKRGILPVKGTTNGVLKGIQCDTSGKGYHSQQDRFYLSDGIMSCLSHARSTTRHTTFINGEPHILTAKERMRLQGFTDDYIGKAYLINEPHIIAAQAGNSVTVNVIESIARNMT